MHTVRTRKATINLIGCLSFVHLYTYTESKNMAVFLWHGVFKTGKVVSPQNVILRSYATKAEKKKGLDRKVGPKIDSTAESLAAKGFVKFQKEYVPKQNVESELELIYKSILGTTKKDTRLDDINTKFNLFKACEEKVGHSIPNSILYSLQTLGDLTKFYKTSVDVRTPLDKMKNMELPENLHIQFEYHRFHPDTDTKFGGVTAFPGSSTIVTGLKYKDKYPGHKQKPAE